MNTQKDSEIYWRNGTLPNFSHKTRESPDQLRIPVQRPSVPPQRNNRWTWIVLIAALLVFLLSVATLAYVMLDLRSSSSSQVAPTPRVTQVITSTPTLKVETPTLGPVHATPTALPGVVLGPQACPGSTGEPGYWDHILGTQPGTTEVTHVSCANLRGTTAIQALVTAGRKDGTSMADVYVYDTITRPHPDQLFRLTNLLMGDAKISSYNTIMTAEADVNSFMNKGQDVSSMQRDLFREFQWNASEQTFAQVPFPGIYPDLTRYQADADQVLVNQGRDHWKYDAAKTAQAMAAQLLHWSTTQAQVLQGGGTYDVEAVVQVWHLDGAVAPDITITLSRLEGDIHNLWIVTSARSSRMAITIPHNASLVKSPVAVSGSGDAFEAQVGILRILDHRYREIGKVEARGVHGMGPTTFTVTLPYTSTVASTQEGLLTLYSYSAIDGKINAVVILKVLIKGNL